MRREIEARRLAERREFKRGTNDGLRGDSGHGIPLPVGGAMDDGVGFERERSR